MTQVSRSAARDKRKATQTLPSLRERLDGFFIVDMPSFPPDNQFHAITVYAEAYMYAKASACEYTEAVLVIYYNNKAQTRCISVTKTDHESDYAYSVVRGVDR